MHDDTGYDLRWTNPLESSVLYLQQAYCVWDDNGILLIDSWELPEVNGNELTITQAYDARRSTSTLVLDKSDNSKLKEWHLFVYDTVKGLWHREDNTRVDDFCSCKGELFYIDHADGYIKSMFGSGTLDTKKVNWMAETGIIGADYIGKKYISKLNIRMSLDLESRVRFYIQYDSSNMWDFLFRVDGSSLRSFTVPIKPKRCDHFRLRIEGEGEGRIYSISKTIEEGSDH